MEERRRAKLEATAPPPFLEVSLDSSGRFFDLRQGRFRPDIFVEIEMTTDLKTWTPITDSLMPLQSVLNPISVGIRPSPKQSIWRPRQVRVTSSGPRSASVISTISSEETGSLQR